MTNRPSPRAGLLWAGVAVALVLCHASPGAASKETGSGHSAAAAPSGGILPGAVPALPPGTDIAGSGDGANLPGVRPAGVIPQVGAVFATVDGRPARHFCTAAVVDSPGRDLLVTAAHCVVAPGRASAAEAAEAGRSLLFVPGYHEGRHPFGIWAVTGVATDPHWWRDGNPDFDVAFLTTRPLGGARRLEEAVGAEGLAFEPQWHGPVEAVGYPGTAERPVVCANRLLGFDSGQAQFPCRGMTGGTSGSPLLAAVGADGRGTVVGAIGGYQAGGFTADLSYSPGFGPDIAALYRTATRG
jgi:V8-like Glu-specific endopeptidase